jgi:hypothetical protein
VVFESTPFLWMVTRLMIEYAKPTEDKHDAVVFEFWEERKGYHSLLARFLMSKCFGSVEKRSREGGRIYTSREAGRLMSIHGVSSTFLVF